MNAQPTIRTIVLFFLCVLLVLSPLAAEPPHHEVIRRRDTTALITAGNTLLFRDRFVVDSSRRAKVALDVVLPARGKLWSATVDGQSVQPVERGRAFSVPLGFTRGTQAEVEVVSGVEKALPPGHAQLAIELPQVERPVLLHRLRLLLPDDTHYRVRRSDLRFLEGGIESEPQTADAGPGALRAGDANLYATVTDGQGEPLPGATLTLRNAGGQAVQVSGDRGEARFLALADGSYSLKVEREGFWAHDDPKVVLSNGRNTMVEVPLKRETEQPVTFPVESPVQQPDVVDPTELEKIPTAQDPYTLFKREVAELKGGVSYLPVVIPETGEVLSFSGVLPPERITLELEVNGTR